MAERYLAARGYETVERNYRIRGGELDLVVRRGELLVFVEVKQRATEAYGGPAAAIDGRKLHRLRKAALHYLVTRYGREDLPVRFDAILVRGGERGHAVEHLEAIL